MSSKVDQTIFEGGTNFDWDVYLKCRPDYTKSNFYPLIWAHHDAHHGAYSLAHDVGTGPGNVAAMLASKFHTVEASDTSAFHISAARARHAPLTNVTFSHSRAEDPVGSNAADLVTVAECLPLMEIESAMSTFSNLLRPGGTLAVWFYGGPIYTGSDAETREIQRLHREITARSFDPVRPLTGPTWPTIGSWLDAVALPPATWEDVRRVKWNSAYPLGFSDDFSSDLPSAIAAEEVVETIEDLTFWKKEVDFAWARGFIDAQIPRKTSYLTEEVERMYEEMRELMEGKVLAITWPVVLILATKARV